MLLCGKFLFIKLSEGPVQLSDCTIDTPSIRAAGLSVHTGPDTPSRGVPAPEQNFTPCHLQEIHTETAAENWPTKAASKRLVLPCV